VNLGEKGLTSVSALREYRYLQEVDVSHNFLQTIRPLSSLKYLTYLNASHNQLKKLLDFKELPLSLDEVDCSFNEIETMSDLARHRFLRVLRLRSNKIKRIEGISRNANLKELDLGQNQIEDIENMEGMNLVELDLSQNRIHLLKGLDELRKLRVLRINRNSISRLAGISEIFSLRELQLAGNLIRQVREIQHLERLVVLTTLDLCFCPIQDERYYRAQILYRVPILRILDGVRVTPQEIVKAGNLYGEEVADCARVYRELLPEEEFIDRRVHVSEFIEEQSDSETDVLKESSKRMSKNRNRSTNKSRSREMKSKGG
jgi:protein phosphatase 1 regulatory subunit 7